MTAFNKKICYKRHKDQKKKIEYNHVHNILRIFFEQVFPSPKAKRSVIISKKTAIYELPQEL